LADPIPTLSALQAEWSKAEVIGEKKQLLINIWESKVANRSDSQITVIATARERGTENGAGR
jgi:hypothetical protein